jgi:chemotaxis methyl-accepting protein methylase
MGHDSDLLSISTAPNLVFARDEFRNASSTSRRGEERLSVQSGIRDSVLFEYHDL